jgi:hypothetical protein
MRYTIPVVIMVSGCVAGGPPDPPLTATWQGAKTLELSAVGYPFGTSSALERRQANNSHCQRSKWPTDGKSGGALQLFPERAGTHSERLSASRRLTGRMIQQAGQSERLAGELASGPAVLEMVA